MSAWGALFFNLAINAVGSFAGAALLVALGAWALRVPEGFFRRLFWVFPLAKVVFDAARGIPGDAFFWAKLGGATQDLGSFRIGAGFHWPCVLAVHLGLGAHSSGRSYSQSIAEPLSTFLSRHTASWAPALLGGIAVVVAALLLLRSAAQAQRWASEARRAKAGAACVEQRQLGRRVVDLLVSCSYSGAPFAGGLLRPYVCFSQHVFDALPPQEREAVIEHELAHLAHLDALWMGALAIVSDLFWFVPGLRAWCRAVAAQGEIAADARAVRHGADQLALASALVRVTEIVRASPSLAPSLVSAEPSLRRRVLRLLDARPAPRLGFGSPLGRVLLTAWLAAAVFISSTLGNH